MQEKLFKKTSEPISKVFKVFCRSWWEKQSQFQCWNPNFTILLIKIDVRLWQINYESECLQTKKAESTRKCIHQNQTEAQQTLKFKLTKSR